jgi:8-oxo-dGTP diphosphatase
VKKFYKVLPFVLGLIENKKGEVLIGQEPDLPHKPYPLKWDIPGGKLEPHEDVADCLQREIKEETGYEVEKMELYGVFHNFGDDPQYLNVVPGVGICYKLKVSGDFKPTEMLNMHYADEDELKTLDLTPWTKYFLREYLK